MEELLKTCQRIHSSIVFIALAILILALTPDIASEYRRALKDLNAFIEVDDHRLEFYKFISNKNPKYNEIHSIISEIARQSAIFIPQGGFELRFQSNNSELDYPGRDWFPLDNGSESMITINTLKKFVSTPRHDATVLDPDIAELRAASKRVFYRIMANRQPTLKDVSLEESITTSKSLDTVSINLRFGFQQEDSGRVFNHFEKETIHGRKINLQASNFLDWLKTKNEFKYLHDRIIEGHMFVGLDTLWSQVGKEKPKEAGRIIERNIAAIDESVSFLGIKIPRAIGIIVGPALCLCAIIYLIGHILHILNVLKHDLDESVRVFNFVSWVAIFPERMNVAVTLVALWFLPTVANCILVIQMWSSSSLIEKILSLAITICTFSAGLYIWILLRKVKAQATVPKIEPAIQTVNSRENIS